MKILNFIIFILGAFSVSQEYKSDLDRLICERIINQTNLKFVKKYTDLNKMINKSILNYKQDVKSKKFPTSQQSFFKKS